MRKISVHGSRQIHLRFFRMTRTHSINALVIQFLMVCLAWIAISAVHAVVVGVMRIIYLIIISNGPFSMTTKKRGIRFFPTAVVASVCRIQFHEKMVFTSLSACTAILCNSLFRSAIYIFFLVLVPCQRNHAFRQEYACTGTQHAAGI